MHWTSHKTTTTRKGCTYIAVTAVLVGGYYEPLLERSKTTHVGLDVSSAVMKPAI